MRVYAVRLMEKYGSINKAQRALPHNSPSVTMIYAMADVLMASKAQQRGRRRASRGR